CARRSEGWRQLQGTYFDFW
nr:immunoglobulin heavy chain junction region [Macaca mulatta]